jgi:hypothetical protein
MMTITITWWMLPTIITLVSFGYVLFIHDDGGGYLSGLGNLLLLVPVSFVSMVAWIIAAFCK